MALALVSALAVTIMLQSPSPPVDDALIAIQSNLSLFKDVQFVFEGQYRLINAEDKPDILKNSGANEDYQGTYAFRSNDAATYLDVYHQPLRENALLKRTTQSLLDSQLDTIDQTPDLSRKLTPAATRRGGPGSFNTSTSPEPFFIFWSFREILRDPPSYRFETLGWEDVEGRKCRKIQVTQFYRYNLPEPKLSVFWLDLERGGLPLKIEYTSNGLVERRTHEIRLQSVMTADGHAAWVPVGGITDYFSKEVGEISGKPFVRDSCRLVVSSIRINQGLTDSFFSIRRQSGSSTDEVMQKARQRFDASTKNKEFTKADRTDPQGVRERLATNLNEAERQATEIKASSVAQESTRQFSPLTIAISLASGIVGIIAILLWRRRS